MNAFQRFLAIYKEKCPVYRFIATRYNFKEPSFQNVAVWLGTLVFVTLGVLGIFLAVGNDTVEDAVLAFNGIAWVTSNVLAAYVGVVLVIFVLGYYFLFDPSATTGGQFIFRFAVSLGGVIGLICISLFLDPVGDRFWNEYPGDVLIWRPIARLFAYLYVAYTISALAVLLVIRKWHPHKLRTARDLELVKPRKTDPQ